MGNRFDRSKLLLLAFVVFIILRAFLLQRHTFSAASSWTYFLAVSPFLLGGMIALFRLTSRPFLDYIVLGAAVGLLEGAVSLFFYNNHHSVTFLTIEWSGGGLLLLRFVQTLTSGLLLGAALSIISWGGKLFRERKLRPSSSEASPSAALFLIVLSPLAGEFLIGSSPLSHLPWIFLLLPLYGGGALFIRETVRRTGRGWPSLLLLAAAYGIIEAGMLDQSLFNPSYFEQGFSESITPIPWLGMSAYNFLSYVGNHMVLSIGLPIALVEMLLPHKPDTPWLGKKGWVLAGGLYVIGAAIIFFTTFAEKRFLASPLQLAGSAAAAGVLILLAFVQPRLKARQQSAQPLPRVLKRWPLIIGSFGMTILFIARPESWLGVIEGAAILGLALSLIAHWSHRKTWSVHHQFGLAAGALLAYACCGFMVTFILWPESVSAWIGNVLFAAAAVLLLRVISRRLAQKAG